MEMCLRCSIICIAFYFFTLLLQLLLSKYFSKDKNEFGVLRHSVVISFDLNSISIIFSIFVS